MDVASAAYVLAAAAVVVFFWLGVNPLWRWKLRHVKGPYGAPFIGNLPDIDKHTFAEYVTRCSKTYGCMFKIWFGPAPWVVLLDPDHIRKVQHGALNRHAFPDPLPRHETILRWAGVVEGNTDLWRPMRKAMEPALMSPTTLAGYLPGIVACADELCLRVSAALSSADGGEAVVDMQALAAHAAMCTVAEVGFGIQLYGPHGDPERGARLVKEGHEWFDTYHPKKQSTWAKLALVLPFAQPLLRTVAALLPDSAYLTGLQAYRYMRVTSEELIREWKQQQQQATAANDLSASVLPKVDGATASPHGAVKGDVSRDKGRGQQGAFLSHQLRTRGDTGLTDLQIASNAFTFLLAGSETTARLIAFAVYHLCQHPTAEAALLAEIDALGDSELTCDTLDKLQYTGAVLNETLRLHGPAPMTLRTLSKATQVGSAAVLPVGTKVVMFSHVKHMDPAYWPRASDFLPERFLPQGAEALGSRHPHAFTPFGGGARMCVGYKFALLEAKLMLLKLYRQFTFELLPGQVPLQTYLSITVSAVDGVMVRPVLRHQPGHAHLVNKLCR